MKAIQGYRSIIGAAAVCMWLLSSHAYAAGDEHGEITIVVPVAVLQGFINEVLPVEIPGHEKVSGVLRIRSIEHLRLGLDEVWFTACIRGENIAYQGKIGGLPANLRFDALDSTLQCEASIRYESKSRLLYVRPKVSEEGQKRDVLWLLLVSVFGDREYPVEIQKLKPIQARVSSNTVEIDMDISNIYTANDRLFFALRPSVRAGKE